MKYVLAVSIFVSALLCGGLIAQSTTPPPSDPGAAQPPATQPVPQTSQAPTPQATPTPQSSTPSTTSEPASSASQPSGQKIAPGSVIPVQLTKTVDAKKAKTGDEVVAKVTQDMKNATGQVLVPKDTKVIGHVTEAQPRSKEQKESQLAIAFDRAQMKDGETVQMPMSIQAIVGQQNNPPANAGNDQAAAPAGGGTSPNSGGRSPMAGGGSNSTPPPSPSADAGGTAGNDQSASASRPPINAQTKGVIGLPNVNLSPNSNATQGSVVTSDKNNVKLESGTLLLLRVNQ